MLKHYAFLFLSLLLVACGKEQEKAPITQTPEKPQADPDFRKFVRQFEYKALPLAYYPCKLNSEFKPKIEAGVKFGDPDAASFALGTFKTNGEYVALITSTKAGCDVPVITTYDRQGKIIDKKAVNIGGCVTGCGFTCTEYLNIDRDYNIYVCDSIAEEICNGNRVMPGSKKEYVRFKKGKLLPDGKIELSEETRAELQP